MNKTQIQRFDTYIQVAEQIMQHKNIKKKKKSPWKNMIQLKRDILII